MKGFCCSLVTSHFLFEQSKQKWLREWEIKDHFSGSAIGRPPWGGQSTGGLYTLHLREAERPQWHDSTAERHRDIDSPGPGATEVVMPSSRDQMEQSSSRSECLGWVRRLLLWTSHQKLDETGRIQWISVGTED